MCVAACQNSRPTARHHASQSTESRQHSSHDRDAKVNTRTGLKCSRGVRGSVISHIRCGQLGLDARRIRCMQLFTEFNEAAIACLNYNFFYSGSGYSTRTISVHVQFGAW